MSKEKATPFHEILAKIGSTIHLANVNKRQAERQKKNHDTLYGDDFLKACENAGCNLTKRQARKFAAGKGIAFKLFTK